MDDKMKLVLFLVVLLVLGLPLVGRLAGSDKTAQTATSAAPSTSAKAAPLKAALPPPPQPVQQPMQQPQAPPPPQRRPPPPPRPAGPPPPMNLANTAWTITHPQYGNITIQLFSNGTAVAQSDKMPMQAQGTWQQNGNSLTVSSMGQSITAQVQGNTISAYGYTAKRLR